MSPGRNDEFLDGQEAARALLSARITELESKLQAALTRAAQAEARVVELREALAGLRESAIVLSDECMERDVGNRPDIYTVHAWSAGEWRRVKAAARVADSALASPSPVAEALGRVVEAVLSLLEIEERYHDSRRRSPWTADQEDEYRRRLDTALLARDALRAARKGEG